MSTKARTARLQSILGAATLIPSHAREAFVREVAGDDDELFAELMLLLADPSSHLLTQAVQLLADDHASGEQPAPPTGAQAAREFIAPGTHVGWYTIIEPLGVGGMGEVYRARDSQLQRDVAIKVLSAASASQVRFVERLKREAKLLAALNHRNIGAIYGLHEEDGIIALILELVEGPTLADRMSGGPLPLADAMRIARQIAEALEAAHEKGIVHRDLKPDNVKVRPDDEVKVLDFGIAKSLNTGPGSEGSPEDPSLTVMGAVFGTPSYMSPEQIRGVAVDRRTDLWAFGLLLWEMIVARPAFGGVTIQEKMTLALTAEPDWTALPRDTPAAVRRLLRRALQKDRKLRLDSAAVARLELDEALTAAPEAAPAMRWGPLPWAVAAACAVALAVVSAMALIRRPSEPAATRVSAELGADIALREDLGPATVLSPDGRLVVFATRAADAPSILYVRKLGELVATPLSSTENASSPFFSPDGKWIAFFADRKLKRISASGGAATVICDAPNGRGGWWGTDDMIALAGESAAGSTIARVPASGGTPQPVTTLLEGEVTHRWPQMLPGNQAVLYTSNTSDNWDDARIVVQSLRGGKPVVVQSGFFGRYVSSGHLLYVRSGTLYAAPFDVASVRVTGPSAVVVEDIAADPTTGGAQVSVSDTGSLAYLPGHGLFPGAPAIWMD